MSAFLLEGPVKENLKKQARRLKRVLETSHSIYKRARQDTATPDGETGTKASAEQGPFTLYLIGGPPGYKDLAAEIGVQTIADHRVDNGNRLAGWDPDAAALAGPSLMWAELPLEPWAPSKGKNYKQRKEKMKDDRRLLNQVLEALENQAACEKGAVFAHPATSTIWEAPPVKTWENLWQHQVAFYVDQEKGDQDAGHSLRKLCRGGGL